MENFQQKTIKHEISCVGVGLHTGNKISMTLKPAEINTGIVFHRTDSEGKNAIIPAHHNYVVDTRMCTCVGNSDGIRIATIEHLMAAIHSMGITNMMIDIDGPETPVMDGSASPFIFLMECAGIRVQNAPLKAIKVLKDIKIESSDKSVEIHPNKLGLLMHFSIDFPAPIIGHQEATLDFSGVNFKNMYCRARTFGFLKDIEYLRSIGLARGGSLDNAILVDNNEIVNKDGLRYKDEFVRHKMLDAVGDLYMLNMPIIGEYFGNRSGHADTNDLLSKLLEDNSNYEIVDLASYHNSIEQSASNQNEDSEFLCAE